MTNVGKHLKQCHEDFERYKDFVVPFGQHKGDRLCTIEPGYLRWMATRATLYGATKQAVDAFYAAKSGLQGHVEDHDDTEDFMPPNHWGG